MNSKKHILVLGSTGAMGQYLVPELANMGYLVDAVSLDDEIPYSDSVRCIKGNAKDRAFIEKLLTEKRYDGVVDFMIYWDHDFKDIYKMFLDNTDHYIYLSSYRVYANEEHPVKETSPRMLDVSADGDLLGSNEYCIYKAQGENLLRFSDYRNYTIIRPAITYSKMRYQLVTLEAPNTVGRALKGKRVLLPKTAKDIQATMTWAGDVAKMIARLLFNKDAYGEAFSVTTAEHRTWGEIAEYYKDIMGMQVVWSEESDYVAAAFGKEYVGAPPQLKYDRYFDRIMDNSKILRVTGMTQDELMPLYDGLRREIGRIPEDAHFPDNPVMDEMLEKYE